MARKLPPSQRPHRQPDPGDRPLTDAELLGLAQASGRKLEAAWKRRPADDAFLVLGDLRMSDNRVICEAFWGKQPVEHCIKQAAASGERPIMAYALGREDIETIAGGSDRASRSIAQGLWGIAHLASMGVVPVLVRVAGVLMTFRWTPPGSTLEAN